MAPLSEEMLIGADASVLSFIREADDRTFRLVVSGGKIAGLVGLADLQQLPVRITLFGLVTYLEMTMTKAIRREFNGSDAWVERLSEGRRRILSRQIADARSADTLVDPLLFTGFADKKMLLKRSPNLPWPKNQFAKDMEAIERLRDMLAHANDYAATREAARSVCATVRSIDHWIGQLAGWWASRNMLDTSGGSG